MYIYNSVIKMNEILPFAVRMALDGIMLSEKNQTMTNTMSHLYVESKTKTKTNPSVKANKVIYREQTGGSQRWWGGRGTNKVKGIKRYQPPVISHWDVGSSVVSMVNCTILHI